MVMPTSWLVATVVCTMMNVPNHMGALPEDDDRPPERNLASGGAVSHFLPPETPADEIRSGDRADEGHGHHEPIGLQAQLWWQRVGDRVWSVDGRETQSTDYVRLSLDWRRQWRLTEEWRVGLSNRFDYIRELDHADPAPDRSRRSHLLRELWLSWQTGSHTQPWYIDVGRINIRNGVGSGYNPTDFFKARSVVNATSLDPGALRNDRLGTVVVRTHAIGEYGAFTAVLAPRLRGLKEQDIDLETHRYSLALDRTNNANAVLLKFAPQISERWSADIIGFARSGERPQIGLNFSTVLSNALVANLEYSGGRRSKLPSPTDAESVHAWRNRLAANATWTSRAGIELTLERSYAGDALSRQDWKAWRNSGPDAIGQLLTMIRERSQFQEPLVRDGWFLRAAWRDAWRIRGLNLSGFIVRNSYDGSALWQGSASHALNERWSVSGIAGRYRGDSTSEFGGAPVAHYLSVYVTRHL